MPRLTSKRILDMINGAAENRVRFERYGFWRFARDSQRQEFLLKKVLGKVDRKRRRRR